MSENGPVPSNAQEAPRIPRHVAIIMDGNGRWALSRNLPRTAGHRAGVKRVREVVEESVRQGVGALTLFAFSSENWRRPRSEVKLLMELFMSTLRAEIGRLDENGVRLCIIGDLGAFPEKLQGLIAEAEQATSGNQAMRLQIAANYGGRWDIAQAIRRLVAEAGSGRLRPEDVTEERVSGLLSAAPVADPDLLIRTGGEQRLSNFLLWQAAYSELYFSPLMWPDFGIQAYREALGNFARRQRRFGLIDGQVPDSIGSGAD